MEDAVNACARLTAEECGDARLVVTDGELDAAVEVCAARRGRDLKALSLMSGGTPRETFIRCRAALDGEDRTMLAMGAYETLRTWLAEKPESMTNVAVQLGFELWRHLGRPLPIAGWMVAYDNAPFRTAGALAARMAALCARGAPDLADAKLKEMFEFALWRLARMARMRADAADAAGNTELALEEADMAERLDACNKAYQRIERGLSWLGRKQGQRLTPREGLAFALVRAAFRMAQVCPMLQVG